MGKVINKTLRAIEFPSRHVAPAGGEVAMDNDTIRGDNWPILNGMILSGQVSVEYDPEPHPGIEAAVSIDAVVAPEVTVESPSKPDEPAGKSRR